VLVALGALCFARLIADPTGLIVDGTRPSIDHMIRGDPRPLGNDLTFVFLPRQIYIGSVIRECGHPPAWDRTGFGGRPLVGNPQSGLFYPPAWLAWFWNEPAILGWITVGHLLWGSAGIYVLARGQGLSGLPALLAAGVFQASPYMLAQTFEGHYPHVWAACWFPWAFWAYSGHRAGRSRASLLLPPILALALLTGHPQEWVLLIVALSAWVVVDAVMMARLDWPRVVRASKGLLQWAAVVTISVALAAIEVFPALSLVRCVAKSASVESPPDLSRSYLFRLENLFQLLAPGALGGPADYFGHDNYWESVFSCGLVPLVLVVAALLTLPARPQAAGWAALVGGSVWFAAGPRLGLYTLICSIVPGMSWFRVPGRSFFLACVGAAMLAGLGLEIVREKIADRNCWRPFARWLVCLGVLLVGLLLLLSAASRPRGDHAGSTDRLVVVPPKNLDLIGMAAERILHDPAFWLAGGSLGLLVACACMLGSESARRGILPALVILALAELGSQGFTLIQVTSASTFLRPDRVAEALVRLGQDNPGLGPIRVRARDSCFLDLQAARYGIEKTNVNDVFQLAHAAPLYETLYPVAARTPVRPETTMSVAVADNNRQIRQGVFDRLAVSYLVSDRVETDPPWPVAATGTCDGNPFVIQRNPTALPCAYVVPRAELVTSEAGMTLARFRTADPHRSVLMVEDPLAEVPAGDRQPFTPVRWLSRDPDRPALEVSTRAPGFLVMADTWMPGWSARVDSRPTRIFRGNHAQRVIPLEHAGRHWIELEYRPPGLALGLAITTLSALAWGAVCFTAAWRGRPHVRCRPGSAAGHSAAEAPCPS
jgi:hypothetical protein